MGLFKKKPDPISERARELNAKIADLETQIKHLSQPPAPPNTPAPPPPRPEPRVPQPAPATPPPQPRLRSTALPHGPTIHPTPSAPAPPPHQEPIFEELDPERLNQEREKKASKPELGMRKKGFLPFLDKMKIHFRGPATSNPKLVNYLAAGSIQGLRPLRYEKRVARNRFIVLAGVLILVLWGILALLLKHR